ncbi:hypothetical protein B0H11DRAFT_1916989 [Mycena galericulata]|nr:hypothetical protein B0H11DRAFT_1916989 [Mycena galericulata]
MSNCVVIGAACSLSGWKCAQGIFLRPVQFQDVILGSLQAAFPQIESLFIRAQKYKIFRAVARTLASFPTPGIGCQPPRLFALECAQVVYNHCGYPKMPGPGQTGHKSGVWKGSRSLHIPEYESGSGQEISTGALPWNSGQDVSPHISKDSSASKESSKIFSDYCTHPLQAGTPDFLFVLYLFAAVRPERLGHPESLFVLYLFATVRPERNSSASKESPQIFLDYSTGLLQAGTSRVFVLYLLATVRPKRNSSASKVSSQIFSA